MKEDEAKRLTPRQIVYIKATFNKVTPSGNVDCNVMLKDGEIAHVLTAPHFVLDNDLQQEGKPTHNEEAEENKPKYDPCRLFRKGDKVRVVECKGRHTGYDKKIYKVCEDEEESGRYIKLSLDGYIGHVTVDAAYLELVTPVEELEPYFIYESEEEESFDIMKRVGKLNLTRN